MVRHVQTSKISSSVPRPPGSVRKASARVAMPALRVCIVSTSWNSVRSCRPHSRSTMSDGMNPTTSPPASSAPWLTAPMRPPPPAPYTSVRPRSAMTRPASYAASMSAGWAPGVDPQNTATLRIVRAFAPAEVDDAAVGVAAMRPDVAALIPSPCTASAAVASPGAVEPLTGSFARSPWPSLAPVSLMPSP